ncbi:MAG: hypothetical protein E6J91_21555 [Deltaproteobacteria bacterium]|nr:MAG: hypothetical protein E6J91_21555 [Deltaproteobacteria bacterium]
MFSLLRSPRVVAIWCRSTSGKVNERVDIRWLDVAPVHPIEQRMDGLVGDDVVRQAREDPATREVRGCIGSGCVALGSREIAEQQSLLRGAVERVGLAECVRIDPQPVDELVARALALPAVRCPDRHTPERPLEVVDRGRRDRVDHLLVELRTAL